jgi:3-dehydroquinate dehydratase-2
LKLPIFKVTSKKLIDKIQELGFTDGIILNAGAYTHTSIAIGDAIKAITTPVIEVHISNTYSRESFRHQSYISGNAKELSSGLDYKAMSWRSVFVKNKY